MIGSDSSPKLSFKNIYLSLSSSLTSGNTIFLSQSFSHFMLKLLQRGVNFIKEAILLDSLNKKNSEAKAIGISYTDLLSFYINNS